MSSFASLRRVVGDVIGRPRRWRFLEQMPKCGVCAEIGVYKGDYSREILRITKPRELHLIDGWWTVEGEEYQQDWYSDRDVADTREAFRQVEALVAEHPECTLHFGDDLEILPTFPNGYFDWVYLDSSHMYEQTVKELEELRRIVKAGGTIAGDDWFDDPGHGFHGVCRAVREYTARYGGEIVIDQEWRQWLVRPERADGAGT